MSPMGRLLQKSVASIAIGPGHHEAIARDGET
jgi:hypothetical protein